MYTSYTGYAEQVVNAFDPNLQLNSSNNNRYSVKGSVLLIVK